MSGPAALKFEPKGMSDFLLSDGGVSNDKPMRGNIFDLKADKVAATQLAIDGEVKHREVADAPLDLKFGPDRPNVLGSQRGL